MTEHRTVRVGVSRHMASLRVEHAFRLGASHESGARISFEPLRPVLVRAPQLPAHTTARVYKGGCGPYRFGPNPVEE